MKEIELKLALCDPEQARLVYDLPVILHYAQEEPITRDLFSVYYDTPDFCLAKNKIALRTRASEDGFIQTLKVAPTDEASGVQVRDEFEVTIDTKALDYECLLKWSRQTQLPAFKFQDLQPLFETHFARTTWLLPINKELIVECVLDIGEVRRENQALPICEIELELKKGQDASVLFQLAAEIANDLEVALEYRSKAWWGFKLSQAVLEKQNLEAQRYEPVPPQFFLAQAEKMQQMIAANK